MTLPGQEVRLSDVAKLLEILQANGWREARLRMGDFELYISDGSLERTAPVPPPDSGLSAPRTVAASSSQENSHAPAPDAVEVAGAVAGSPNGAQTAVIRAPSLGTFWRAPNPGAPPFVAVGDVVGPDTPLAIIEVMKMMTRIAPNVSGTVAAVHVEDGDLVEFDQPLVTIAVQTD